MLRVLALFLLLIVPPLAWVNFGFKPEAKRQPDTLVFCSTSKITTLDPQKSQALNDSRIITSLLEPLLRFDPGRLAADPGDPAALIPGAAAALPELGEDGRTYTFKLRPDAKWSNGDPVTARDFDRAWMRGLFPDMSAPYTDKLKLIEGGEDFFQWRSHILTLMSDQADEQALAEARAALPEQDRGFGPGDGQAAFERSMEHYDETVRVDTPDDHTLVVRLEKVTPYFPELAAFMTFSPLHADSAMAALRVNPDTGAITMDTTYFQSPDRFVTNGAYQLDKWDFGQRLELVANPLFRDHANRRNQRLVMLVIEDEGVALLRFNRGEVDWCLSIASSSPLAASLVAGRPGEAHLVGYAATYYYSFNCSPTIDGRPNPFADARVRRALSMAIDRKTLVREVTQLNQPIADSFIPEGQMPGYTPPDGQYHRFDPAAAKALLAEAGYGPNRPLRFEFAYNTGGGHEIPGQAIANMWKEHLGVTVTTAAYEWGTFQEIRRNKAYEVARNGWFGDYRDPSTFLELFRSGGSGNVTGYADPEYDRLIDEAGKALEPDKRARLFAEAEQRMLDAAPMIPLWHYTELFLYDENRVQGLNLNPWSALALHEVAVMLPPHLR
ncbi:MAG: peptide ABC transporter substrate-binding protein [Planctomycetota bacterium]